MKIAGWILSGVVGLFMLAAWLNRRPKGALALLEGARREPARVRIAP